MDENKKLLEALRTIKDECEKQCKENKNCERCPMSVAGNCAVCDLFPHNWNINDGTRFQALF